MDFVRPISIISLATDYQLEIFGLEEAIILGLNELHRARKQDLIFVDHPKYYDKCFKSESSVILINEKIKAPSGKILLYTKEPFEVFQEIVKREKKLFYNKNLNENKVIDPTAKIHPTAIIEDHVRIGAYSSIGAGVYIGSEVKVGEHVIIEANSVIGSDAFYFHKKNGVYTKWISCGNVLIENDVFIGAGTTINKGVTSTTRIGKGTKIDCQVQIGHGVLIGENCLIAAQVGIAGKTIISDGCSIYGQVGIAQNIIIEEQVTVLAKSGVSKNLEAGKTYFGYPADEVRKKYRELSILRNLSKK